MKDINVFELIDITGAQYKLKVGTHYATKRSDRSLRLVA